MAKYDVTHRCGHTGEIDLWGKGKDREWKLKNAEGNLCKECWIEQQKAKPENKELYIHIEPHFLEKENGEKLVYLYFSGATYENKEAIKELGFVWGEEEMPTNIPAKKVWKNILTQKEAKEIENKIKALGAILKR